MPISATCPHCETAYTLNDDLLGKEMRCPNRDCREVFTVAAAPEILEAEVVDEEPFVAEVIDDGPKVMAKAAKRAKAVPAGPREVTFDGSAPPPGATTAVATAPAAVAVAPLLPDPEDLAEDEIFLKRRRRKGLPAGILIGLIGVIVVALGGVAIKLIVYAGQEKKQLIASAEAAFKNADYAESTKLYTQLLAEHPGDPDTEKYEFFKQLSELHAATANIAARDTPAEGVAAFDKFLSVWGDNPIAQPDDSGFGFDVFEAGRKTVDNVVGYSQDKIKSYTSNRTKLDSLGESEAGAKLGLDLLPRVEKYRVKDLPPLEGQKKTLDELVVQQARERRRLVVLAPYRTLPQDPTADRIAAFLDALRREKFDSDAEAQMMLTEAKKQLRKGIVAVKANKPPVPAPAEAAPALLFVAPPLGEKPLVLPPNPDAVPQTVFASARGFLYAVDADSGTLLWAVRTGTGVATADDVPVRVSTVEGGADSVLVPSDINGVAGLTSRQTRTGEALWHQPLEAAVAGRPIVVGTRAVVPLKDDAGSVVEFDLSSGNRLGHIPMRMRLGAGAVRQPGTGLVFVPGEGRRVFVLDADAADAEGNRLPLICLRVINTDHPEQSLRVPPIITGPAGDSAAPRFLVLCQADGTDGTKVRAFPVLPPTRGPQPDGPPEVSPPPAASLSLPGHVTLPPASDGERVAIVTDAGTFALFGANQIGNQDAGLYAVPIPVAPLPADAKSPIPGGVVFADEDEFWILARADLIRLRVGLTPQFGVQVARTGDPKPTGTPLHRPQVTANRDTAVAVVRSDETDGVRMIALDPRDGRVKWERKLGLIPAATPAAQPDGGAVLVDEDGGVFALPPTAAAGVEKDGTAPVMPDWVTARPSLKTSGPPRACALPDGTVWVVSPENGERGKKALRVRQIVGGKIAVDVAVALPDNIAGDPVPVAGSVAVPLVDGFVYKFDAKELKLVLGPMWRGEKVAADARCFTAPAGADGIYGSDGGTKFTKWRWPANEAWAPAGPAWTLREKLAFAPVLVDGRLLAADVTGSVWLYDPDRAGEPKRRWRPETGGVIPPGLPVGGFTLLPGGKKVAYTVGKTVIALDPNAPAPAWAATADAEVLGASVAGNKVLLTSVTGAVVAVDAATGKVGGSVKPSGGLIPRQKAVPFGPDKLLLIGWDGSAAFAGVP